MSNFVSGFSKDAVAAYNTLPEETKSNLVNLTACSLSSVLITGLGSLLKSPVLQKVGFALNVIGTVGAIVASVKKVNENSKELHMKAIEQKLFETEPVSLKSNYVFE